MARQTENRRANETEAVVAYAEALRARFGTYIGSDRSWLRTPRALFQDRMMTPYRAGYAGRWEAKSTFLREQSGIFSLLDSTRHDAVASVPVEDSWGQWWAYDPIDPFVLIAEAGSGKTAMLEHWALQAIEDVVSRSRPWGHLLVPVFVSLAGNSDLSLDELLARATPGLRPELLATLRETGQLLVFIDGFDEVPAARARLHRELGEFSHRVVISSRPGHGAEDIAPDSDHCWWLDDLTPAQARELARQWFESVGVERVEFPSSIRALVTKPLYLLAWCDSQRQPDPETVASQYSLGSFIFESALERKGAFAEQRRADPHAADVYASLRSRFADWIGRLGCYFANRNFRPGRLDDAAGRIILTAGATGDRFAHWAIEIGLLNKVGDSYFLPKVPLVEFCMGKYLATDAVLNPDAPTVLIESFRRWIWQPVLHDALDFAFDALWRSEPAGVRWADELLAWAVKTARNDPWRDEGTGQGQDDLLMPFAITVLRWYERRPTADDGMFQITESIQRAINEVPEATRLVIGKTFFRAGSRLFTPLHHARLLPALVEKLVQTQNGTGTNVPAARAAELLSSSDAAAAALRWFRRGRSESDGLARANWFMVAVSAAGCISPEEADGLLETWVVMFPEDEAWESVIRSLASRIPERQVLVCIRRWLHRVEECHAWWDAIFGAAEKIAPLDAFVLADELLGAGWWGATSVVVGRLDTASAQEWAGRWLPRFLSAGDKEEREVPQDLLCAAASRLIARDALELVRRLLVEMELCDDLSFRFACARILEAAATRLDPGVAADIVEELVPLAQRHGEGLSSLVDGAVFCAAARVSSDRAAHLVCRWLNRFVAARSEIERRAWCSAAEGAASRLGEKGLRSVIELGIRISEQSNDDDKGRLIHVLAMAMEHAKGDDGAACADMLFEHESEYCSDAVYRCSPAQVVLLSQSRSEPTANRIFAVRRNSVPDGQRPLLLNDGLHGASDAIKVALLDTQSELEHPDALTLLITLEEARRRDPSADPGWMSRKNWFTTAGVNSKRGREAMLMGMLIRRQFIETFEEPNAGQKSKAVRCRINAAGIAFIARRRSRSQR